MSTNTTITCAKGGFSTHTEPIIISNHPEAYLTPSDWHATSTRGLRDPVKRTGAEGSGDLISSFTFFFLHSFLNWKKKSLLEKAEMKLSPLLKTQTPKGWGDEFKQHGKCAWMLTQHGPELGDSTDENTVMRPLELFKKNEKVIEADMQVCM